ncbi:unnamed protein product [Orchesella dallaii]|uniref:Uncharacterized protein n=1 Tax=Orchesella dallaii TaxID=48710 RepID=A0ABP1QNC7_9HEXA
MSSFSTTVLVKLMLMGLLSFALLLTANGYYSGLRYGKRLPYEVTRVNLRSSTPRVIQSRSQVRFYAGSRYGGKRSYWDTSMSDSESSPPTDYYQQQVRSGSGSGANSPIDCLYVPYVGVRCLPRNSDSTWSNLGESDEDSGSPNTMNGNPSSSSPVGGSDAS